jgi:hypothetical protein
LPTKPSATSLNKFLGRLVNLPDDVGASQALLTAYKSFLTDIPLAMIKMWFCSREDNAMPEAREWSDYSDNELIHEYWLIPLRDKLRSVWANPSRPWCEMGDS